MSSLLNVFSYLFEIGHNAHDAKTLKNTKAYLLKNVFLPS